MYYMYSTTNNLSDSLEPLNLLNVFDSQEDLLTYDGLMLIAMETSNLKELDDLDIMLDIRKLSDSLYILTAEEFNGKKRFYKIIRK